MYERLQSAKRLLRGGTACLLALFLCGSLGTGAVDMTGMTSARSLVPVGHTVGIKLFSKGVVVVKMAEGVDMFPFTSHVESVVLMSRVK